MGTSQDLIMKYTLLIPILFQQKFLTQASRMQRDCFGYGKVCNSLSLRNSKSFENDFSEFRQIILAENSIIYSDALSNEYLGTTETAFSLYSLCHESYPNCRYSGVNCFCNAALKEFF